MWEAAALGKPLLLVPLDAGSRGDQVRNAKLFESKGAAEVWQESTGQEGFEVLLQKLTSDPLRRQRLSEGIKTFGGESAAKNLADEVESYLNTYPHTGKAAVV